MTPPKLNIRLLSFCLAATSPVLARCATHHSLVLDPLHSTSTQNIQTDTINTLVITGFNKASASKDKQLLNNVPSKVWSQIKTVKIGVATANTRYFLLHAYLIKANNLQELVIMPTKTKGKNHVSQKLCIDPTYFASSQSVYFPHFKGYRIQTACCNSSMRKLLTIFQLSPALKVAEFSIDNNTQAGLLNNWTPQAPLQTLNIHLTPNYAASLSSEKQTILHNEIQHFIQNNLVAPERDKTPDTPSSNLPLIDDNQPPQNTYQNAPEVAQQPQI